MKSTKFYLLGVVAVSALISQSASAADVVGQVGTVTIVGSGANAPGNYDFRVTLATGAVICNGQNWVYVNTTDANYSAIVASVLSAKALGSTVTFFYNPVGNYCQLTFMAIN
jgi:hypothetical protein